MKKIYRILSLFLVMCTLASAVSAAGIVEADSEHIHEEELASTGIQEAEIIEDTPDTPIDTEGIVSIEPEEELPAEGIVSTDPIEEPVAETDMPVQESVSVPAAATAPAAVPDTTEPEPVRQDRMTWTLDEDGTLRIGGKGVVKPIDSADQQPWANKRSEIKEVYFNSDAWLHIEDIAYWFAGCSNLTYVELPAYVDAIGTNAFSGCIALEELALYHSQAPAVSDDAFSSAPDTFLCVYARNATVAAAMSAVNWHNNDVEIIDLSEYPTSTFKCMGDCYCTTCTWHYEYDQRDEDYHWEYAQCDDCSANEYAYGSKRAHQFSGNTCYICGYTKSSGGGGGGGSTTCYHTRTYNEWSGCTYYTFCYYCDEYLGSGVEHGTYTYSAWNYYSSSQHRRLYACSDCGEGDYQYASHSTTKQYTNYSDTQHSVTSYCASCSSNIGSTTYATHTYTYGSWSSYNSSQHRRTKGCTLCNLSSYDYGNHADGNSDGKCDTCSYAMTFVVTWNASSNGGTVNGANTITTTVSNGATATAPSYTPVKTGHTFKGWYTTSTGSALYNTVTVTSARTFYAQFTASNYTITFDPGEGSTGTTTKTVTYGGTYGELPVPTRGGYNFDGWFTAADGGTQITADSKVEITANTTLYAQWTRLVSFSVTVPAVLPLVVDENGEVYGSTAAIVNNSTGMVSVSAVTLSAQNGWSIAPFSMNTAREKVDSNQIGFSIQDVATKVGGSSEDLDVPGSWHIAEGSTLELAYDAIVTALSQPVSEVNVLSAIFVLKWTPK